MTLAGNTAHLAAEASSGGSVKLCKVSHMRGTASSGGNIETESGGADNELRTSSGGNIGIRSCS